MAADPFDEAAHRWYMSASVAAGEPAKALAAYEALRQRPVDNLGTDPAPQTRDLHLAILREQDPGCTGRAPGAGWRRADQPNDATGPGGTRRRDRDAAGGVAPRPSRVGPG